MYGKRIREIRTERNLNQSEFAELLGISQRNVSKYELEQLDLNTDVLISICEKFNLKSDYVLGLEDDFGNSTLPALSNEEQEVLALYRKMNRTQKSHFIGFAEGMLGVTSANKLS